MRILYLARTYPYPPAAGGDMVYTRGVITALAKVSAVTALVGTNGSKPFGSSDADGVRWVVAGGKRGPAALSFLSGMPNIVWRSATRDYQRALAEHLQEDWDGIVLDNLGTAHALPLIAKARCRERGIPILYLSNEFEATARAEKYREYGGGPIKQAVLRHDGEKVARWEGRLVAESNIISVINPDEQALYAELAPDKRYIVTTPGFDGAVIPARRIDAATPRRVALLGGRGPKQKQVILVRWLDASVKRLAAAGIETDIIGKLDEPLAAEIRTRFPEARTSGFVADLPSHLQTCRIGVVPDFLGRGVKLRLLDLIFARVPLFGLQGAISGLPITAGDAFLEAPTLDALTDLIVARIDDLDALNGMQESAFAACDGRFEWAERGSGIVAAFQAAKM